MPTTIRVLLAEDVAIVRKGLMLLLASSPDVTVFAEAASGEQALELARSVNPDVVLMDLSMPGLGGVEAIAELWRERPGLPVVALTGSLDPETVAATLRANAAGYLLKSASGEELAGAVRAVASGRPAFCREVFSLIAEGARSGENLPLPRGAALDALTSLGGGAGVDEAARELAMSPEQLRALVDETAGLCGVPPRIQDILLSCMSVLGGDPSSPDKA